MIDEFDYDFLAHFGIKGMRWGHHKPVQKAPPPLPPRPRSVYTPERPRTMSTKSHGQPQSREDALVSRAINQGYDRSVRPAMDTFIRNIPPYQQSPDPRVNALMDRVMNQALDRVETRAGAAYMAGLPATYRQ